MLIRVSDLIYKAGKSISGSSEFEEAGDKLDESMILEYLTDIAEEYLGDMIEELVERYYSDKIDLAEEYPELLGFITLKLVNKSLNGDEDPDKFRKVIGRLSRRKSLAKAVISYLISEYISERDDDL